MKVAIVYDRVNKFGGAERVLLSLHKIFPEATLFTSVYDAKKAKWAREFKEIKTSFLQKISIARNNHEYFFWAMPFLFSRFNFDGYDLVISVTSEFAKNLNTKTKHISYCLTPTRYLWSHNGEYINFKFEIFNQFLNATIFKWLKRVDYNSAQKPDEIVAISTEVQKRIKKYYGRKSQIIFPPVSAINENFKNSLLRGVQKPASRSFLKNFHSQSDKYYLIVSRLVKYKKVDLVIETFNELQIPLIVVGTGREEKRLKRLARKNIKFLGHISDQKLVQVYKNAHALIFPQVEDFGIVAVEAQMYGLPVIAYGKGGVLDTVSKNTGIFFEKQNKKDLIKAIRQFEEKKFDRKNIINNAKKFSEKRFKEEFLKLAREM